MAKNTSGGAPVRGAKLVKKAIEAGKEHLSDAEPVAAAVIKRLVLPNGEPVSAGMKELLKVDALWLGIDFDEEEGDIESMSLDELIEDNLGKQAVKTFSEAVGILEGDCIPIGGASDHVRFLYVGEADEQGEYPVVTLASKPTPWIGGFVPFDVWLAQELGALKAGSEPGAVAPGYEDAAKALADANGDGRLGFEPTAAAAGSDEEDEDEDEDEDDEEDEDEESEEGEDDEDEEGGEGDEDEDEEGGEDDEDDEEGGEDDEDEEYDEDADEDEEEEEDKA